MIRALLSGCLVLNAFAAVAQLGFGNEWIAYDRQYWRFQVYEDGIYRIDSLTLANAGFPLASVAPADLMLFAREQQVPIYIEGGDDGVFNDGDFIEFVGRANDGWLDALMYTNPGHQPNPYFSLHNDSIRYYLTWDPAAPKERVQPYSNTDFSAVPMTAWAWGDAVAGFNRAYYPGFALEGVSSGFMTQGEGWMRSQAMLAPGNNAEVSITVPTPRLYTGAGAPEAEVHTIVAGANHIGDQQLLTNHHLVVGHGAAPGTTFLDTIFSSYEVIRSTKRIPHTALGANVVIRLRAQNDLTGFGQAGSTTPNYTDRQALAYLKVRYGRDFNLQNVAQRELWLQDSPNDDLAHVDFGTFSGTPVLYSWGQPMRRIIPTQSGNRWKAMVPADGLEDQTRIMIHSQQTVRPVLDLVRVNGTGYFTDFSLLEADSALLIVTHASLMNAAMQYANYRENQAPMEPVDRRSPVVLADVDELYDQFGGGIPKNSFAIRRYGRYLLNTWSTDPQGLFLIGKSVQTASYPASNQGIRSHNSTTAATQEAYARCLVPTYGQPPSDPCLTIGLRFDPRVLEIPVGRLSASSSQEVLAYLGKVQAFEAQQPAAWMKNILHFRGGFNSTENQLFQALMNGYKTIIQDTCFGGNVITFSKNASTIFQQVSADSVRHYIEDEGVTLMTFMAHAYASGFDISIDNPANYNWNGKHPLILGNSCYIGNVHLNSNLSTSEQWTLMPAAGPVGFLASVDVGYPVFLSEYSREFYRSFGSVNYGRNIGRHMRHATFEQLSFSNDIRRVSNSHTFTLQGDPMLVLNSWPKPDYVITPQDVSYDPVPVNADVDTFQVRVAVANIGKAVSGAFNVALDRTTAGLSLQNYLTSLNNVYLRDTAVFNIPTLGTSGGQGLNNLAIRVDLDPEQIDELDNTFNNQLSTTLQITSGDLVPVYPYNYAIVPEPTPTLKGSTGDPLAPVRNYVFEIDTTDLFNSPVRESVMLSAPGGVVSWQPQSIYALNSTQDSTVFYWRCSIDSTGNGGYNWYERSFQYITGKHGWGQAHYFQFKNNGYSGIVYDRPERDFDFFTGQNSITATVHDSVSSNITGWQMDLVPQDYNGCFPRPAWHVVVIDPSTFEPWGTRWTDSQTGQTFNPQNFYNNANDGINCRNRVEYHFIFRTDSANQLAGLQNMMAQVPVGHHMLFYTWRHLDKAGMAANAPGLMPAMEALGGMNFSTMPDSVAYIWYVRKGFPGSFTDTIAGLENSILSKTIWINSDRDQGTITTMEAGPASAWHGLYWNERPQTPTDSTRISLIGVTPFGVEVPLANLNFPSPLDSVPDLGSLVNAVDYPKLRIRGSFFDLDNPDPIPAQMERWQLLSSPVPECAIHPPLGFYNGLENLFQGQNAKLAVAVQNISEFDMDSLLMGAWVVDRNNVRHRVHYRRNAPLPAGAVLIDTVQFSTLGLGGENTLIVEANTTDTLTTAFDQVEQYRFNNVLQMRFAVEVDRQNPLLDVTFDGIHILDGDIVSARPEISVSLNDENTVLLLNSPADTANFKVFLQRPNQPLERIYFRDGAGVENMQFLPATGPDNISRILYRPNFATDGKYMLTVQAKDLSNNQSGDNDYRIGFEVINRPTITEVLNYPNPFTTSTRFVFTVTGVEPPTYMKIQIMTVTGRVIREVKMHELGPIRVGRNISEFAWDGTDEFGDRLGRGVYLYRVIAQLNGEDIEYRSTGASEYFTKGFGKMYLLR